jgi:hypothetical protein
MTVRLTIALDADVYRRLKKMPRAAITAFINKAIRARIHPDGRTLDAAYKAASKEAWRRTLAREWSPIDSSRVNGTNLPSSSFEGR